MSDKDRVLILSHALGVAVGALETINVAPYDFNKDGLVNALKRVKELAEAALYTVNVEAAP